MSQIVPARKYFSDSPIVVKIIDLYVGEGLTCRWIEDKIGIDHNIIKRILIENNVPLHRDRIRKPLSKEHIKIFSKCQVGKKLSKDRIEHRENVKRERRKNGVYVYKYSEEVANRISDTLKRKYASGEIVHARGTLGKPMSERAKIKQRFSHSGNKHWNWRGGTKLQNIIRHCFEYRAWRTAVFNRDGYTCVKCGHKGYVEADHIKPFCVILRSNEIKTFGAAVLCKELWDINNGRTLCKPCHKKTDTYFNKSAYD